MNRQQEIDNAYTLLAAAIIQAALDDYKSAVKSGNKSSQRALEKWFNGKWCDALSMGNGKVILEMAQKELVKRDRRKKNDR
jgi:peptidyl-tRNA hydrolase